VNGKVARETDPGHGDSIDDGVVPRGYLDIKALGSNILNDDAVAQVGVLGGVEMDNRGKHAWWVWQRRIYIYGTRDGVTGFKLHARTFARLKRSE